MKPDRAIPDNRGVRSVHVERDAELRARAARRHPGAEVGNALGLFDHQFFEEAAAILARGHGYFGLANYMGSKFLTSSGAMETFTGSLRKRGLAFIDDGTAQTKGGGIPRAGSQRCASSSTSRQIGAATAEPPAASAPPCSPTTAQTKRGA